MRGFRDQEEEGQENEKKKSVGSRFASIRSLARAAQYQYTVAQYYEVHSNEYPNLCMRQFEKESRITVSRG